MSDTETKTLELAENDPDEVRLPSISVNGHTIQLTPTWTFCVTGPEMSGFRGEGYTYPTYTEAVAAINKAVELKAKTKALNYSRIILDSDGALITTIGFNRSDGDLKLAGNARSGRVVFPNVPWLAEKLKHRAKLAAEINDIDDEIQDFAVRATHRVYRGLSADEYNKRLQAFDAELDKATAGAVAKGEFQ